MTEKSPDSVLEVRGLSKTFKVRARGKRGVVHAVREATFDLPANSTVAIVGESGSGKSTLARLIIQLVDADRGDLRMRGVDLFSLRGSQLREAQRKIAMVFQDPNSSLDPAWQIQNIVTEGVSNRLLRERGHSRASYSEDLLESVGLDAELSNRFPYELSGGQRQRVSIARALAVEPEIIIFDEALSALDVSTQARILDLIQTLRSERDLSYLFISHDLRVVEEISDYVVVMYLGNIVEQGPTAQIYGAPAHPYTRALLDASPVADPIMQRARRTAMLSGEQSTSVNTVSGCVFAPRCPLAQERCRTEDPPLLQKEESTVLCHFPLVDGYESHKERKGT